MTDWEKWRRTYEGGDNFRDSYLERFSNREDQADFATRKNITPVPKFAGAAINDIRNAIYQRLRDVVRKGGSDVYQAAVNGNNLGVDHRGATMNAFLGVKVLTELLVMGRVGVYVDHPFVPVDATLANIRRPAPYLYKYDIEDILSWTCSKPESPSEFQALLLRDTTMQYDQTCLLPTLVVQRYRYLRISPETGKVHLQFYNLNKEPVDPLGNPGGEIQLELDRIPFVMLDIGGSLIKDVCQQQIALLNLGSSDVNYALRSNFPFYIEQRDLKAKGGAPQGFRHGGRHGHQRRSRRGRRGRPDRRDARPLLRQDDESTRLHRAAVRAAAGEPGVAGPLETGHPRVGEPGRVEPRRAGLGRVEGDGQPGP